MTQKQSLKLFEERNVRTIWDDTQEKWYFSVVDVIQVLTENDYQTAKTCQYLEKSLFFCDFFDFSYLFLFSPQRYQKFLT